MVRKGKNSEVLYYMSFIIKMFRTIISLFLKQWDPFLQVKISTQHPEILERACEHFLTKSTAEIETLITATLEGHQRAILGAMTVEVGVIVLVFCVLSYMFVLWITTFVSFLNIRVWALCWHFISWFLYDFFFRISIRIGSCLMGVCLKWPPKTFVISASMFSPTPSEIYQTRW